MNISISPNTIVALVGENGSGKTTLFNILSTNIKKDTGTINFFGNSENTENYKEHIGVVFDDFRLPNKLTLIELNNIFNCIYKTWSKENFWFYTRFFNLPTKLSTKNFSKGMKMKLSLTIALSHDSKILLLDEFTTGMDSGSRLKTIKMLKDFSDKGNSILFSSHIPGDIDMLANKLIFMKDQQIIWEIDKNELFNSFGFWDFNNNLNFNKNNVLAYKIDKNDQSGVALVKSKENTSEIRPINSVEEVTELLMEGVII
ncbi:ATP-binding cassette domain-containing protein [Staphylococcus hominis]